MQEVHGNVWIRMLEQRRQSSVRLGLPFPALTNSIIKADIVSDMGSGNAGYSLPHPRVNLTVSILPNILTSSIHDLATVCCTARPFVERTCEGPGYSPERDMLVLFLLF